ncbi:hypothetical protein GLYMA_06G122950v4 [Glycine max]|nr:hypothetical protein GLYMA_06G122950v4 [Glycine max]KAH1125519.1 hypothetical protein GYH30_014881 [Glycine max]
MDLIKAWSFLLLPTLAELESLYFQFHVAKRRDSDSEPLLEPSIVQEVSFHDDNEEEEFLDEFEYDEDDGDGDEYYEEEEEYEEEAGVPYVAESPSPERGGIKKH